jgi:hypothetical protein
MVAGHPAAPAGGLPPPGPRGDLVAVCGDGIEASEQCHDNYPTGCSANASYDPALNKFKNLLVAPTTAPSATLTTLQDFQSLDDKLPAGLKKANSGNFQSELEQLGEGKVVAALGYLYYAKDGDAESSNCGLTGVDNTDFHIGIGFDAALAGKITPKTKSTDPVYRQTRTTSVIVEMTPHYREGLKPSWDLPSLKKVVGWQVRVTGQLLADNEHNYAKDNCHVSGANMQKCWRGSVWELHPVTRFQVCNNTKHDGCTVDSTDWKDLEDLTP